MLCSVQLALGSLASGGSAATQDSPKEQQQKSLFSHRVQLNSLPPIPLTDVRKKHEWLQLCAWLAAFTLAAELAYCFWIQFWKVLLFEKQNREKGKKTLKHLIVNSFKRKLASSQNTFAKFQLNVNFHSAVINTSIWGFQNENAETTLLQAVQKYIYNI